MTDVGQQITEGLREFSQGRFAAVHAWYYCPRCNRSFRRRYVKWALLRERCECGAEAKKKP